MSVLLILVTGVWQENFSHDQMVAAALSKVFPFVAEAWPFFVFVLGYSSIVAFVSVGKTAASHLSSERGEYLYFIVATILLKLEENPLLLSLGMNFRRDRSIDLAKSAV